jgi:hypothetical protein
MRNIIPICSLIFACNSYATDLEKVDIEKCSYLGGIARETQVIRSATGDSFDEFKLHSDKIYKNGEGYTILLGVVWEVYASVDLTEDPTDVFNSLFDYCINKTMLKRQQQEQEAV